MYGDKHNITYLVLYFDLKMIIFLYIALHE